MKAVLMLIIIWTVLVEIVTTVQTASAPASRVRQL